MLIIKSFLIIPKWKVERNKKSLNKQMNEICLDYKQWYVNSDGCLFSSYIFCGFVWSYMTAATAGGSYVDGLYM